MVQPADNARNQCERGYGCGNTCISRNFDCNIDDMSDGGNSAANDFTDLINSVSAPTPSGGGGGEYDDLLSIFDTGSEPEPPSGGGEYDDLLSMFDTSSEPEPGEPGEDEDPDIAAFMRAIGRKWESTKSIEERGELDKIQEKDGTSRIVNKIGENTVDSYIDVPDLFYGSREVNFKVNDSYFLDEKDPRISKLDDKGRAKLGLTARSSLKKLFKTYPDGSIFHNTPADGDGKGADRRSAYQTFGFRSLREDGSGKMYGILQGGKMKPYNPETKEIG